MINNSALEEEQGASEPLTAMIDVIFTLIAFMMLMINTPLASMEVSLPSTDATAQTITVKKRVSRSRLSTKMTTGISTNSR